MSLMGLTQSFNDVRNFSELKRTKREIRVSPGHRYGVIVRESARRCAMSHVEHAICQCWIGVQADNGRLEGDERVAGGDPDRGSTRATTERSGVTRAHGRRAAPRLRPPGGDCPNPFNKAHNRGQHHPVATRRSPGSFLLRTSLGRNDLAEIFRLPARRQRLPEHARRGNQIGAAGALGPANWTIFG
jgi:hypothetical protein